MQICIGVRSKQMQFIIGFCQTLKNRGVIFEVDFGGGFHFSRGLHIVSLFEHGFNSISAHHITKELDNLTRKAEFLILPFRREERMYPRQVKRKTSKYAYK